jgi:hypothetical protein
MSVSRAETRVALREAHFDNLLLRFLRCWCNACVDIDVNIISDVCHIGIVHCGGSCRASVCAVYGVYECGVNRRWKLVSGREAGAPG